MISHKHKCIYIHIPRTAGTSIEFALCGDNWWKIDSSTKHLLASQAKEIYADYWDSYFKFSIVRDPCTRMLSALRYANYFCPDAQSCNNFKEFLEGYMIQFGFPKTVEFDYRFYKSVPSARGLENSVYLNLLDEELDYVGRFENLNESFGEITKFLGLGNIELSRRQASKPFDKSKVVDRQSLDLLEQLYRRDYEYFGYELPDSEIAAQ